MERNMRNINKIILFIFFRLEETYFQNICYYIRRCKTKSYKINYLVVLNINMYQVIMPTNYQVRDIFIRQ